MANPTISDPENAFVSGLLLLIPPDFGDGLGEILCVAHIENDSHTIFSCQFSSILKLHHMGLKTPLFYYYV